ncbi:uncharacterized protein LOC111354929 isoform X1 [Spodoptera litura]|uniref:Uncharacterized protein LOC111354929 isoform X1 n=1 Tax=Spodoptera litura TaxID=69820 RepID=A0A9J7E563_SPOLT|nr:uncharacterized protein LOC111354929 isoform X1 [Spodoptera litura]
MLPNILNCLNILLTPCLLRRSRVILIQNKIISDQQLANIDPRLQIDMDPLAHRHLRPEMMFIREELRQAKWQTLAVRRTALKKLLLKDFMQEDCELRNIGLAYSPPDP